MEEIEIVELINETKQHNDQAMEKLLQFFKPKVTAISREYFLVGGDFDDIIQEGMIGLYKAISIYDGNKNHNFKAFASLCIHRQIQNAVKNANIYVCNGKWTIVFCPSITRSNEYIQVFLSGEK